MNKNDILMKVKEELTTRVEQIDYKNLEKFEKEIQQFLHYLKLTNELPIFETETIAIAPVAAFENVISGIDKLQTPEQDDVLYEFERKVRGGVVLGLEGGYVIPEKMVRDMEVEHGDKLRIISYKQGYPKNMYWFEIAEKNHKMNPKRMEYKYCKVEKDFGEHMIKSYHGGFIKVDEVPFQFIIDSNDVETFGLKEGDIVDIAYYLDNPASTMKVLYKYELHESVPTTVEQKKLSHTTKKIATDVIEKKAVVDVELFENKNILVVGGGSRHPEYEEAIKKYGANVELATGDENKKMLSSMISKADAVAITIGECSHDASIYTVNTCKKMDKSFSSTDRNGIQSLLLCVEEALLRSDKAAC